MNKGLEAWLELAEWMVNHINRVEHKEIEKDYFTTDSCGVEIKGIPTSTITKELQRLEAIDNANPSEALKQLGDISYFIMEAYSDHEPLEENQRDSRQCFVDYCKNIQQALLKAKEQEKALKIIKNKWVDLYALFIAYDLEDYNIKHTIELTQEEFDLLKEVLGNE